MGVQELRREVAELRDTVEVQRNELEKLRERQRQLYDDLDYRLRQTEQSASVGQGAGQAVTQGSAGQQQLEYGQSGVVYGQTQGQQVQEPEPQIYGQESVNQDQQIESQAGQQQGYQESTAAVSTNIQQAEPQVAVASAEEQAAYDDAFELLKQSRYNDAVIEFRSMIAQFPNGALVDDGQYWIGEAFYVTRDFESALTAFDRVVKQYPDSQRVPEALLKLGYVQYELGQTERAKQTLNQVIAQYPGSRVAISAETRLSKIR